jgi:hypothetical protein
MAELLDKSFDEKFNETNPSLIWLPWVGQDYSTAKKKLLIVGESHYDSPNRNGDLEFADCIRWFVQSVGIDVTDNPQPLIRNTEKALFGKIPTDNEKIRLWNSVSYHIMVQRILESIKERPHNNDFLNGWNLFFQVVDIIKPDFCLFCGVTSANFNGAFIEAATKNNYKAKNIQAGASVDNVASRVTEVSNDNGQHFKIVFMRHPSQYFSWAKWTKIIGEEINEYTNWLTEKTSS